MVEQVREAPEQQNTEQAPEEATPPKPAEAAPKADAKSQETEASPARRRGPMSNEAIEERVKAEVAKAVGPLHTLLNEEKAARELAENAARYGEDSPEHKEFRENLLHRQGEETVKAERLELALERAADRGIPASLLEGKDDPNVVRAITDAYVLAREEGATQRQAADAAAENVEESIEEPSPTRVVTSGGGAGAAALSDDQFLEQQAGDNPDTSDAALAREISIQASKGVRPLG